jgi:opacity protein-like surface antigen
MRFAILLILLAFSLRVEAFEYRHKDVKRAGTHSFYISIGFIMPLKNNVANLESLNPLLVDDLTDSNTGSFNQMFDDVNDKKGINFASKKIGGLMSLGYKMPYFLRTEIKLDFATFSRYYKASKTQFQPTYDDIKIYEAYLTIRQIALMGNLYIDFDNSTAFTPYLGFGLGQTSNQIITIIGDGDKEKFSFKESGLFSNLTNTYELNVGLLIGSRRAFVDIEGFQRNTPEFKIKTKGVRFKASFII